MRRPRLANPLLRHRDGRLFLAAQALDATANGVALVALPWLVLDATGSKAAAGMVFTVTILPYVVFGLLAGLVGDRFPRRRVIWIAHGWQALVACAIPTWSVAAGTPPLGVVLGCAFAIGTGRAFADAGAFGAVASLVGADGFPAGQAILSAAWSLGLFAGPALGGALIGSIGAGRTLIVEAAAFTLAAGLVLCISSSFRTSGEGEQPAGLAGVGDGVRLIFHDPILRALTTLGLAANVVSAGAFALIVPLLRQGVGLTAGQAGQVLAVGALTGVASAPLVRILERRLGGVRLYVRGLLATSLTIGLVGAATGFATAMVAVCVAELVNWTVTSTFIGERQRRAPEHLQARVGISGRMLMMASLAAGSGLASALTRVLTLRQLYAAIAIAAAVVGAVAVPVLRRASERAAAMG